MDICELRRDDYSLSILHGDAPADLRECERPVPSRLFVGLEVDYDNREMLQKWVADSGHLWVAHGSFGARSACAALNPFASLMAFMSRFSERPIHSFDQFRTSVA